MAEEDKVTPGKLFFARVSSYDGSLNGACSVESVEEAEELAKEAGIENDYSKRWIVGFALVRNVHVSYTPAELPKPAESKPELAAVAPEEIMDLLRKRLLLSPAGQRNNTANRCGFSLGKLIGSGSFSGVLDEYEAERGLVAAAMEAGLSESEATAAVRAGIRTGISNAAYSSQTAGSFLVASNGAAQ